MSKRTYSTFNLVLAVLVHDAELDVDGERQRDRNGHDPDDGDEQTAHAQLHARLERMHNDKVAIDGDGERGERAHIDTHTQRERYQMTEELAQVPVVLEERDGRERHG